MAGSRVGAGNVSRYRSPNADATWSKAPMTFPGAAPTATPPVPVAAVVQNSDAADPPPAVSTTASSTPADRIRSMISEAGSPPASGSPG